MPTELDDNPHLLADGLRLGQDLARMAVFISYNSRDNDAIPRGLKRQLDAKIGECTFFDRASIKPGAEWKGSIEAALERAQVLFLVAGPRFFDDEQMQRLTDDASVIRRELEAARQKAKCTIIPAYFDCEPPHRSGKSWPAGMHWLGDLQWVEIRKDRLDLDLTEICNDICRLVADKTTSRLRTHSGAVSLISVVESASPEVLEATKAILGVNSPGEARLRKHLLLLREIKIGNFEWDVSTAIQSSGIFTGVDVWLSAIYVLRYAAMNTSRGRIPGIESLDYELRKQSNAETGRAPQSALHAADQLLMNYLSIVVRRLRERSEQTNLDAPTMLHDYFARVHRIDSLGRQPLDSAIVVLNRWGIAFDPRDVQPFLGRGRLGAAVRIVERHGHSPKKGRRPSSGRRRRGRPH